MRHFVLALASLSFLCPAFIARAQPPEPAAPTSPAPDTPLPTDANVVSGALDNGLRYMVMRHDKPPGRASLWLHVHTGSLNETDRQRGLAHYLEHMAFNGSANFPPGSVVPLFESLGMTIGRHQNARTSLDQTVYMLTLPDAAPETLDKGMLFLSDAALRLTFPDAEIENERRIVLEERRAGLSPAQRVNDLVLERIAPGSIIGQRLPIGTEDTVAAFTRADFLDYYSRWYVPSNMTLLAVADADPGAVIAAIKARFSEGRGAPRPQVQDPGVKPTQGVRAIIAADRELTQAGVSMVRVWPAPPPVRTVGQWRRELVRRLALQTFNRRLSDKQALGLMKSLVFRARAGVVGGAMLQAEASAEGQTDDWPEILSELAAEVQRARAHGFTADELARTRAQITATARRSAQAERTRPAQLIIGLMNQAVAAGEPFMSATQEYELGAALLPGITDREIAREFSDLFDPADMVLVLSGPFNPGEVSQDEVVALAAKAFATIPPADPAPASAGTLLEKLPEPGEYAETADHAGASVTSAWLANGARVHHRFMDYRHQSATVSILLAGGELLDTARTRGLARAASVGWIQPATARLASTDIKNLLTGKNVTVIGRAEADAMVITVSGTPENIESGLQVAHLMLTDPLIEAPAFDQWQRRMLEAIERAEQDPVGAAARLLADTVYPPGEVRPRLLTAAQVTALTLGAAQEHLRRVIATAPIEVAVVGDIDRQKALDLVARYIGSLPARERIGAGTFKDLRGLPPPEGPEVARREIDIQAPRAVVIAGFFAPDAKDLESSRLMQVASRILSSRMHKEVREEKQLVYTINTSANPGVVYPGYGLVSAQATADPANTEILANTLEAMFARFAAEGPTAEEVDAALKQASKDLELDLLEPGLWSIQLRDLTYRGKSLDDIINAPIAVAAFTGDQIRESFARFCTPQRRVRVIVVPK